MALGANYWKKVAGRGPRRSVAEEFRKRLQCPNCDGPLELQQAARDLRCAGCSRRFAAQEGMVVARTTNERHQLTEAELAMLEAAEPMAPGYGAAWERALAEMGDLRGRKVLDACSGGGWAAVEFARRGAATVAFDASMRALAAAQDAADGAGVEITCVAGDALRIPFAAETFDVVFAARALHALKRPERLAAEAARLLAPGGKFVSILEPIAGVRASSVASLDPRAEGGGLSAVDYAAIFREGGLAMESVYLAGGSPATGLIGKLKAAWRDQMSREERIFIGTVIPGFRFPGTRDGGVL